MPTKHISYRLELPGDHVANWMADRAATNTLGQMPIQNRGVATVNPEAIQKGLTDELVEWMADATPEMTYARAETARRQIEQELQSLPDHIDTAEYITNR
jgi:glutamine synthetase